MKFPFCDENGGQHRHVRQHAIAAESRSFPVIMTGGDMQNESVASVHVTPSTPMTMLVIDRGVDNEKSPFQIICICRINSRRAAEIVDEMYPACVATNAR